MDETQSPPETIHPQSTTENNNLFLSLRESPLRLAVFLLGVIMVISLIGSGLFLATQNGGGIDTPASENGDQEVAFEPIAPYSLVYGYWEGNASKINAANFQDGNIYEVASLPFNIKKVTVISANTLLFINNTDIKDHGSEISSYDTSTKSIKNIVTASDGFGIDDYQISPSKRYIALWEVSIPEGESLSQGISRVYTVDIESPGVKNLIYDENLIETIYAHYPVGVTDNGEVFFDTFKPNDKIGWAYGMSYSDFEGTNIQDLPQMGAGTYSTQPVLSPDGQYLAFAGYDGSNGNGVLAVGSSDGYRQAIISSNTIDILNTTTKSRIKLPGLSNNNFYSNIEWDKLSGNIFYTVFSAENDENGDYIYDLSLSSSTNVGLDYFAENPYYLVSSLNSQKILIARYSSEKSTVANLGPAYMDSMTEIGIYNESSKSIQDFNLNTSFAQYIGVYDSNLFEGNKILGSIGDDSLSDRQLQLGTFSIKPTLAPVRIIQQSDPPEAPDEPVGTPTPTPQWGLNCPRQDPDKCYTSKRQQCRLANVPPEDCCPKAHVKGDRACMGSPLYLYGDPGQKVSVQINTPTNNLNVPHSKLQHTMIAGDGGIEIDGEYYENIDFDYLSALKKLPRLDYGKTIKLEDLGSTVKEFGKKLGLTEKELNDVIEKIKQENIGSKYLFVSFYSDEISKAILPITFNPVPDVYRNIVFYLKPLDRPFVAKIPTFEGFRREGFTAVEVSYILDN